MRKWIHCDLSHQGEVQEHPKDLNFGSQIFNVWPSRTKGVSSGWIQYQWPLERFGAVESKWIDPTQFETLTIHVSKVGLAWLCISALCACDRVFCY